MTKTVEKTEAEQVAEPRKTGFNQGRRKFLAHTGAFTAGLMGTALLGACSDDEVLAQADKDCSTFLDDPVGDAAVLQFALNLEYLEAEFYLRATTGMGLPNDLITAIGITEGPGSTPGDVVVPPMNGGPVPLSGVANNYANEIAADERDHVRFLRTALQQAGVPVPARPKINLNQAFVTAATAAGLPGAASYNPFANETFFLLGAYIFEDVGVTAYKGAAPFLKNETYLSAAAGILAAEAYHAGLVRTVLYSKGATIRGYTDAISDARDSLDGTSDLDQGTLAKGTPFEKVELNGQVYPASNIAPLDKNGIAFSRTPGQVLNVAYLNPAAVDEGGFFPNGTIVPANPALTKSADSTGGGAA